LNVGIAVAVQPFDILLVIEDDGTAVECGDSMTALNCSTNKVSSEENGAA
jgi:hypothetical protein